MSGLRRWWTRLRRRGHHRGRHRHHPGRAVHTSRWDTHMPGTVSWS
ncbi:hypothetical protein [Thermoactinospora rubra]|nr:hypothetical protein [Thermoactinospora rubra]